MLTIKSDHICARYEVLGAIVTGKPIPEPNTVLESFRLLVQEVQSLALGLDHVVVFEKNLKRILNSISLPDGGSFHLSLMVLLRYRSPRSI